MSSIDTFSHVEMLLGMKESLEQNTLDVCLVKSMINPGRYYRIVTGQNPLWYKKLCSFYPSSRKRRSSKFDTIIRRKHILRVLDNMIVGVYNSKYCDDIIDCGAYCLEEYGVFGDF